MNSKPPKDHCDICTEIRLGCEEDERNPQNCQVCANRGYIGNPSGGMMNPCAACPRGFRLKLWIVHEKREGHYVPDNLLAG